MLSERTIINGLIVAAGVILGPYLVVAMLEGDEWPLLGFAAVAFLALIFFTMRNGICILPLLGISFVGKLNFLPYGFGAGDICSLVLILYFVITYLALRQRTLSGGPPQMLLPILVLAAIVLYHDHDFGLRILGNAKEGSRPGLLIVIVITTYICAINIPSPPISFLKWLPLYCVIMTCLSSIPFILTTYLPSLTPFLYHFTDAVNTGAYFASRSGGGNDEVVGRLGFQAAVGAALQVFLVSYFPMNTWWRPDRWFVAILSLGCCALVMSGGYRSGLMLFFFSTFVAGWCYSSWRILVIVPLILIGASGLSAVQEDHPMGLQLPVIAQRTLSFLPGHWDQEATDNASASNDFRKNIERVYVMEYLHKSPWFGNGFTFDPREAQVLWDQAARGDTYDRYYEAKGFIITKTFHIGWISLYDAVGLVGCVAFVILGISVLFTAGLGNLIMNRGIDRGAPLFPLRVWLVCNLAQSLFGYFTVFGNFSTTLPTLCIYSIILVHLNKIEAMASLKDGSHPHQESLRHAGSGRLFPV